MTRCHRGPAAFQPFRDVSVLAAFLLLIALVRPASAQTSGPWGGWVQCQFDVQGTGYSHQEVQTWTIAGPPVTQSNVDMYPATWSVTGKGNLQKMTGAVTETAQWTAAVPPMAARIGITTHADRLSIQRWTAQIIGRGGLTGRDVVTNASPQPRVTMMTLDVDEQQFATIDVDLKSTQTSGSSSPVVSGTVGPLRPRDAQGRGTCTWQFVRGGATASAPPPPGSTPTSTSPTATGTTTQPNTSPTLTTTTLTPIYTIPSITPATPAIATPTQTATAAPTQSTVTSPSTPVNALPTIAPAGGFTAVSPTSEPARPPLWGWADLHTHPMSNLAFGGKLFHGAPDVGSLMPAVQMSYDPQCRFDNRAKSIDEALSDDAPTHGDLIQSQCGNSLRNVLIQVLEEANDALRQPGHAVGSPSFANWPRWNDITHQKMWVDWIRRARDGGLRVMVALSHNNRTLGEAMGSGGPISGVKDDMHSSDLQIAEIAAFVGRHNDFMEVAKTSADLYRIVQAGKIAIVLGVEIDNIGDFNDKPAVTAAMIDAEIGRLYAQGVRYVIPIHLTDNLFGDTALYSPLFNVANFRENGKFWTIGCARVEDRITYQAFNFPPALDPFIPPGVPDPPRAPDCPFGHVNGRTPDGLTALGQFAVKAMMKRGMIVDIDHMSNKAVDNALQMAWDVSPAGYPMMSGHSAVRDGARYGRENSRTAAQLQKIACLGGMFGLGTDGAEAYDWANQYIEAFNLMARAFASGGMCPDRTPFGLGSVAFGTDMNSLVRTPRPTMVDFEHAPRFSDIYNANNPANIDNPKLPVQPKSTSGSRTWDYNVDGVAHYGMFADFVKDVRTAPIQQGMSGKDLVDMHLLVNADYFFRMWQKAETQAVNVH